MVVLSAAFSLFLLPLAFFCLTVKSPHSDSSGKMDDNSDSMEKIYDRLTNRIVSKLELLKINDDSNNDNDDVRKQYWIAIAGGAGAGKSTVAAAIQDRLNARQGKDERPIAVVVPMDGFHYSQETLKSLHGPDAMLRRGAPWTFDAEQSVQTLKQVKRQRQGCLPIYSREISDPIPEGMKVYPWHRVILVEGLYLLHKNDPRYAPLFGLWDETWFVKAPDTETQLNRLVQRSLITWSATKTQQWGPGVEGATKRVQETISKTLNAWLIVNN